MKMLLTLRLNLPTAQVPCAGCVLCCQKTPVLLIREAGDVVDSYEHVVDAVGNAWLRQRVDGACVYLGEGGCTIHERVPYACRAFDCRKLFSEHTRKERREMMDGGMADRLIMARGRELWEKGKMEEKK